MFILKRLKVLCFDTLLQVFIVQVLSGIVILHPHTPVIFVKADSKGVASAFGVKAVDKGLTGAFFVSLILSWNKEEGARTAYFRG